MADMVIVVKNQTAGGLSYLGGLVTVAANGSTTVPSQYMYPIARDSGLNSDCYMNAVILNDGTTDYAGVSAVGYLNQVATSIGGAVVSLMGTAVPNYVIMTGMKDPSSNSTNFQSNSYGELTTQFRNKYTIVTGNTTSTVKSGAGRLHGIMVNKNWTGGNITIYDNTSGSGTIIADIDLGTPSGGLLTTTGLPSPAFLGPLGLEFNTGLTIVSSGSSDNSITILYQ